MGLPIAFARLRRDPLTALAIIVGASTATACVIVTSFEGYEPNPVASLDAGDEAAAAPDARRGRNLDDLSLTDLTISPGTLTPAFNPEILDYDGAVVSYDTLTKSPASVVVRATSKSPTAIIEIGGARVASSTPSAPIRLTRGDNRIDVTVTAPDGAATRIYRLKVLVRPNDYIKATRAGQVMRFGGSLAMSDDTLVVGAASEERGADSGWVYVFRLASTWQLEGRLAPSRAGVSGFGRDVAISGDTLVATGSAGEALVFVRTTGTWNEQASLTPSDGTEGFYGKVAISNDTIVLPSSASSANGTPDPSLSRVYVFTRSGGVWSQQTRLSVPSAAADIALSGDTLAVVCAGTSGCIFTRTAGVWSEEPRVTVTGFFPTVEGIAVSADTLALATPQDGYQGLVHVFRRAGATWSSEATLNASKSGPDALTGGPHFGVSLALLSNTLVVGADHESDVASLSGSAYVFSRVGSTWVETAHLKASNVRREMAFGSSVSLSTSHVAVGAPAESSGATGINGDQSGVTNTSEGAVYVY